MPPDNCVGNLCGVVRQADLLEQRGDAPGPLAARRAGRLQRQRDVARGGPPRQQRLGVVLKDDRDVAPRPFHRRAVEGDDAAGRLDQSRRHPQRRGLAASGRTDDADDFAAADFERQLAEHEVRAESEIDVAEGDQGRGLVDHGETPAPSP